MAKITLGKTNGTSFDIMDIVDVPLGILLDFDHARWSSTRLYAYDNASNFIDVGGSGFTYRVSNGEVQSIKTGTVTSFKAVSDGTMIINITGASINAAQVDSAILADSTKRFVEALLSGSDNITGTTGSDFIWGAAGNDIVNAGSGNDKVEGGAGQDKLLGAAGNDVLLGGAANDRLEGGTGNDRLYGGLGKDVLVGGTGADRFVFNTALNASTNVDTITDFSVVDDTILLENAVFTRVGGPGKLAASAFVANNAGQAMDAGDRIIYERDNGHLYYDSNGNAAGGRILIADLAANLNLTHNDFVIV